MNETRVIRRSKSIKQQKELAVRTVYLVTISSTFLILDTWQVYKNVTHELSLTVIFYCQLYYFSIAFHWGH